MPIDPNIPLSVSPGPNLPGIYQAAQNFQTGEKRNKLLDLAIQERGQTQEPTFPQAAQAELEYVDSVINTVRPVLSGANPQQILGEVQRAHQEYQQKFKRPSQMFAEMEKDLQTGGMEAFTEGLKEYDAIRNPQQPEELKSVAAGTSLYDPTTRQVVYKNEKTETPDMREDPNGVLRYTTGNEKGQPVWPGLDIETPEDPKNLQTEEGLRKEFNTLLKDFYKVSDSYARIQASGESPSAAGDLALIFNYMKMLDPGSTVREGEFANAENSAGLDARIRAQYNKVISGQRLADEQRADFLSRSEGLYQAAKDRAKTTADAYSGIADRYGVNTQNVIAAFTEGTKGDAEIPTIGSDEEYNALPSGTVFVDPEGVRRRKP